jgi:hypothetical protein
MVVFAVIHGERTEPFDKRSRMFHWFRTEIAGARRTLDDIEEILARYAATDPRIHFALCNGTRSAPRLALQPYRADDLDAALASTVRDFVNDTQKNRFVPERQRADVSRIFAWHRVDFERAGGSIAAYLRTFVREPGADALLDEADVTIGFLEYDWTLNAAPKEMPR